MLLSDSLGVASVDGRSNVPSAGTAFAITHTSRVAAFPELNSVNTWGGARNRADRVSVELTLAQVTATIDAARVAAAAGVPLNRHITVHWERAGVTDDRAAAATGAFIKLASQFLQKRGERFAYAWIRENDDGDGRKGSHVHILAHVRPDAAASFVARQRGWLERVTGNPYRAGVIQTRRIGGWLRTAETNPELYQVNLGAILAYVVKGASREAASALGLHRHGEGGQVIGKRAGRSQKLGAAPFTRLMGPLKKPSPDAGLSVPARPKRAAAPTHET